MNNLHSWFYANGLRLSPEKKTTAESFHTKEERSKKPHDKFDNMDIAYKSETKFLGICISEYMK
jgi:hypothetical protein